MKILSGTIDPDEEPAVVAELMRERAEELLAPLPGGGSE
jgi:hypothetical protein